jgi:protein-tyrosine kinase
MSRIYEALQKAESERTNGRATGPRRVEPASSASLAVQAALAEQEPELTSAAFAEPEPSSESVRGLSALDLSMIPLRSWKPSLKQLPALEERGPAVEQFRSLRSRIRELHDISPLKSILISSGMPQEGKSFVAANLAISLARNKNTQVLLIDGDMRRYTLHQLLGCDAKPGLADYLAGRSEMVEVMQRPEPTDGGSGDRTAGLQNVTFIAGGGGGDKAADLSGNPRFQDLITAAGPMFDWIIVDSSPVLPVSDAVNLARACDGVLLVARSGVTQFTIAQRAQTEMRASNILGFILNAVEDAPQVGGYYGYEARTE